MKLAMLEVVKALKAKGLTTKLIIQVHDELVFEGPKSELTDVAEVVKEKMEGCYKLSVPLQVEMEYGDNWRDLQRI
jgi:DNA polymerase-1